MSPLSAAPGSCDQPTTAHWETSDNLASMFTPKVGKNPKLLENLDLGVFRRLLVRTTLVLNSWRKGLKKLKKTVLVSLCWLCLNMFPECIGQLLPACMWRTLVRESAVGVSISGTPGTASHLVIGLISHTATPTPTLTCLGKGYQTNFVFL